ncbi:MULTISPECIES: YrdB family protein [Nocardia]|uniref:YrdB family protein n=1 Tax=Nocardia coubleae TaxID=356147 RepID=A0A846WBH0_9NOCA|nr:YrdB family protein [Nocardia coubleae]NKX90036.1 YrdB family protein [Nocardia coubleae]
MSLNPALLAVRFLLELIAITSFGVFGWRAFDSPWRYLLVVVLPVAAAVLWGTLAVPDDPSRSGDAPVPVPGPVRLGVELAVLFGGAAALWAATLPRLALISAAVLVGYHLLAYDRVLWLLTGRTSQA